MTRVAYLVSEYAAPSHTFVRREIGALRRRGLTILPFTIRRGSGTAEEEVPAVLEAPHRLITRAAGTILSAPGRSARAWLLAQRHCAPGLRGWLWAQFHFAEALALAAMLRAARADRLHSHFANSGATVGMLAAQIAGIPWSLTLHGISETDPPAGGLLAGKIARADFVACASWFMRAQGMRVVPPEQWGKFHIVRCGVELDRLRQIEAAGPGSRIRFVTVGRVSAEKGYPGLLRAFGEVVSGGVDAELVIVGDGPLRADVEQQIAQAGLGDRVELRGALPERETLAEVAGADVFVLASLMEGLPVVLMEAMALGRPVIAPHLAGIPELVRDEDNGLLFRPADWDHLASSMRRLATEPAVRLNMAKSAQLRIEHEFNIDQAVEPLCRLCHSVA